MLEVQVEGQAANIIYIIRSEVFTMKIATYNVWNENKGIGGRFEQLIQEIICIDADIIALQEVTSKFYKDILLQNIGYQYCEFSKYTDEDEGLAILSKYSIESCTFLQINSEYANSKAQNILLKCGKSRFSITNVHIPCDSAKEKEEQIVAVDKFIHTQKDQADYFILLGDFNSGINSSIHRFLIGEQTINNAESNPYWLDIMGNYTALNGLSLQPTLDCINNPRWKGKNTIYAPENVDRIYILDNWEPMKFINAELFGTAISPVNNLSASDHYGVVVEVDFSKRA